MECLRDWIGILGCDCGTPLSGIYLNTLPGMSVDAMDKVVNADQATFIGLWTDIQTVALKQIETDLIAELGKRYRIRTISQSIDLLRVINAAVENQTAPAAMWRGFTVELTFKNSQKLVSSSFQALSFQTIALYIDTVEAFPIAIKIFDLSTGGVLDTFTITTPVEGWNLVQINRKYTASRIFIAYDSTHVTSIKQDISQDMLIGFQECYRRLYGPGFGSAFIRGANTSSLVSNVTDADLTTDAQNIFGLTAIFSLQCRYDSLACNNKDVFTLPLWYLLGSTFMMFRKSTNRLNRYTTVDKKQAEDLKGEYDVMYKEALMASVGGINLNTSDSCIECNAQLQTVEAHL